MNRRRFFGGALMAAASPAMAGPVRRASPLAGCGCPPAAASALTAAEGAIRVTGFKTFGV